MDRKEFLLVVWKKGIKPTLLIVTIFFCVRFLYKDLTEGGTIRFLTALIIGFGLLTLIGSLVLLLFHSLTEKLNTFLPEPVKLRIRVIRKLLNYFTPIVLGIMIYHFWKEDWLMTATMFGVLLIQKTVELIKEEKQALTNE
jgi:hypothetical protein